ncbi:MAG: hypothetical protein AAB502_09175, partial [Chloroflexota bacterium]
MAKILLEVQGKMGEMSLDSVFDVLRHFVWALKDLDRHLSQKPFGSLKWVISDVKKGSLGLELKSVSKYPNEPDYGKRVSITFA